MKTGDLVRCGEHTGIIIEEGTGILNPQWLHILWFDGQSGWKHKMLLEKIDENR